MTVIADTGPIIALAKIGKLRLLASLFGNPICIPGWVYRELMARVGDEGDEIDTGLSDYIQVVDPTLDFSKLLNEHIRHLGKGERTSLLLAHQNMPESLLIMDDKAGRKSAKALAIPITGSVGVIIMAKRKNLIGSVGDCLITMRQYGYWLSDSIILEAKKKAGE